MSTGPLQPPRKKTLSLASPPSSHPPSPLLLPAAARKLPSQIDAINLFSGARQSCLEESSPETALTSQSSQKKEEECSKLTVQSVNKAEINLQSQQVTSIPSQDACKKS